MTRFVRVKYVYAELYATQGLMLDAIVRVDPLYTVTDNYTTVRGTAVLDLTPNSSGRGPSVGYAYYARHVVNYGNNWRVVDLVPL